VNQGYRKRLCPVEQAVYQIEARSSDLIPLTARLPPDPLMGEQLRGGVTLDEYGLLVARRK
jgi:hypothetical protein